MENNSLHAAEILAQAKVIQKQHPEIARNISETPMLTLDYESPEINEKEMKDYNESLAAMIDHSDATSIGDNGIISSHPRPDARRVLDDTLLEFDLKKEVENIKQEGNWAAGNQSAKTLMKSDNIRVVLIAMHQNNEMKMHQSAGPLTLQVIEGNVQFTTWQNCITIKAGQLITLHKKIMHNLLAKEQSIVLLSIFNVPATTQKKKPDDTQKVAEENDLETIEQSENINFPDYPTLPGEHNAYITSGESESNKTSEIQHVNESKE